MNHTFMYYSNNYTYMHAQSPYYNILWTVTITLLSLYYLRLAMGWPFLYKLPGAWGYSRFSDPILALYIYSCSPITLKMISEHAMVLTCSYTLLFLSFINCLILSWGWLYLQREGERERERKPLCQLQISPYCIACVVPIHIRTYSCVKNK